MKPRSAYRLPHARLLLSLIAAASTLSAQTAPASASTPTPAVSPAKAPTTTAAADVEEKPVELSPFTVNSADDQGYRAENTLAGSRLNSALRDTPGVLDVLTADFLADIGATTLEEALAFSANFAEDAGDFESQGVINTVFPGSQAGVSFRTRGLKGSIARNYLETNYRPSFFTTERIDNSSGPNAILFGLGNAGGVVNITTKQAKLNRNEYSFDFRTDEFDSRRYSTDINLALVPKIMGLRINAVSATTKRNRANFTDKDEGIHLAGKLRLGARTELRGEFERQEIGGSVAYPGPHLEQVSSWLGAGGRTVALPDNWETLTAAQRTAIAGVESLAANSATATPIVVQNADRAYIFNQATALSTAGTSRQSIDPRFYTVRGNINGPGGSKAVNRRIYSVFLDHQLGERLYLSFAHANEDGDAETYQAFANGAAGGAIVQVDAQDSIVNASQIQNLKSSAGFTTLPNGRVANPYAGKYYTQSRWLHRTQENSREVSQATIAWAPDFGKIFGSHRIIGTASYSEQDNGGENFRDNWLGAPFNPTPANNANGVIRRRYASPLDAENFHVPDWRDFPELTWNHPTLGPIKTGWVTEGATRDYNHKFSYLAAFQSYYWNRRLVLTGGYRVDEISSTDINSAGVIARRTTRPNTRSIGLVFHATKNISPYFNQSTSLGVTKAGVTVGPDAIVGPDTPGRGIDTGIKFSFLNNKIALDVGYFKTSEKDSAERLNLSGTPTLLIGSNYNSVFTVLNSPIGAPQLLNRTDPAAVAALRAAYPMLRTSFLPTADLIDQQSSGYEARLTANPFRGLQMRVTFAKSERSREQLYPFTQAMTAQLRKFVSDLQAKNPGINVGNLAATTAPTVTINQYLDTMDDELQLGIDQNGNNFGAGKMNVGAVVTYTFSEGPLKGFGATLSSLYRSAGYIGYYQIRQGGTRLGDLVENVELFGEDTYDFNLALRYRTRVKWLNRANVTFSVQVNNLLDDADPTVRRINNIVIAPGAPRPTTFTPGSYFIRSPRSWNASARFSF